MCKVIPYWWRRLTMLSNYKEWQAQQRQGGRDKEKGKEGVRLPKAKVIPRDSSLPTDGVMSYNQMRRVSTGGVRPPSEVGSVRSFRSVLTVEDQVNMLEDKVQGIVENQKKMDAKIDQILALLATKEAPPKARGGPSGGQ